MPFFALTAPPCAPVVGMGTAELEGVAAIPEGEAAAAAVLAAAVLAAAVLAAAVLAAAVTAGTAAFAPSRTSTWPAATAELAVAVTSNSDAILLALADEPAPARTSVVVSEPVFPTFPAL
jgi:hypothetical protein